MTEQETGKFVELWPATMYSDRIPNHESVNAELIKLFRGYQASQGQGDSGSFVSPDNFANDTNNVALDTLKQFIMDGVYQISLKLNQEYWVQHKLQSLDVNITGLWFQISNNFSFHETHVHGNCSWSGVYYVQSGNASHSREDIMDNGMLNGVTRFYGPDMDYSAGGHGDWGNYYLHHSTHTSYPEDGTLLVFPSHIKHTAFPYSGEQDRIVVSFHAQVVSDTVVQYDYSYD